MKLDLHRVGAVVLMAALSGAVGLSVETARAAEPAVCDGAPASPAADEARRLVDELRGELAEVEDQIRNHPYLAALEDRQVSLENLRAFAGEQYNIIRSDLRSAALLVARFGATPSGDFFHGIMEGEVLALDLLLDFAAALGLDKAELAAYEPRPGAQAYPAYVAWLALYGSEAEVAAAFLANFPVFGENTGRMSAALQGQYGMTPEETAFFDFFASPIPDFECDALAVIEAGLEHGAEPRLIKRAARLLQAYEKLFWDTVAEDE